MRLIVKARKMAIGTIVYRRSGAMRKVAEGKWVPLSSKELKGHQNIFDKVSAALRSVSDYDYKLSTTEGHAQLTRDKYTALKKKFPSLSISLKRFVQISNKKTNLTGWDVEEDIANTIIKKMSKARKMSIGTISHGRKKVAEGKWVTVKQEKPSSKEMSEEELISAFNKIADKYRTKKDSKLSDLTDRELYIWIAGKTLDYGRSIEDSLENARYQMMDRKKAEKQFGIKHEDLMGFAKAIKYRWK